VTKTQNSKICILSVFLFSVILSGSSFDVESLSGEYMYRVPAISVTVEEVNCQGDSGTEQERIKVSDDECYFIGLGGVSGYGWNCKDAEANANRECISETGRKCLEFGDCEPPFKHRRK
jgi:hypothetical protein